jgi:hypothetical protein
MYSSIIPIVAWTVSIAICVLAWIVGGRAERMGAFFLLAAALAAVGVHEFAPKSLQPLLLLADDGLLALGFLYLALRYTTAWLGGALLLQGVQFSLHAYYFVAERAHDRFYSTINNIDSLGVTACVLLGTVLAWRRRLKAK